MSSRRPVQTASPQKSIWKNPSEDIFRQNVIALSRATNGVPSDPSQWWSLSTSSQHFPPTHPPRVLSFESEQRLANDFAFIAASQEGVDSVAAVVIEEAHEHSGLIIRIAANEGVEDQTRKTLGSLCDCLMSCAKRETKLEDCMTEVSRLILRLCRERILSRMRLFLGQPPGFVRSARAATNNTGPATTLARMRAAAATPTAIGLVEGLSEMKKTFETILQAGSSSSEDAQLLQLESVVRQCFVTTTRDGQASFRTTLKASGFEPSVWFQNKYIMQIDKLGAYRRIPATFAREARRERSRVVFSNIKLQFTHPYTPKFSRISLTGKRVSCHVHAEVQLVAHYLLSPSPVLPRVMGTSKEACFLCHMFISKHGAFEVSAKHGRLYDQWTIPDLAEYSPENVTSLRAIIKQMVDECKSLTKLTHPRRPYPLTSRHNLRELPHFSPTGSALGTKIDFQADGASVTSGQEIGENAHSHGKLECSGQENAVSADGRRLSSLREMDPALVHPRSDILPPSSEKVEKIPESLVLGQIRSRESSGSRSSTSTARLVGQCQIRLYPDKAQFIDVSPDLGIRAEIEAPASGRITLTRGEEATSRLGERDHVVKLEVLKVGQEVDFQRREDENSIVLHLGRGQSKICSLSLRWA